MILDAYFVAFPAVKDYMDRTVAEARERGYTETLFGRRRPIPELLELELPHPPGRRAPGHERRHPGPGRRHLQGGAGPPRPGARATAGSTSRLILQVHDEVLVEVPRAEHDAVGRPRASTPCAVPPSCDVPLEVNLSFGRHVGRRRRADRWPTTADGGSVADHWFEPLADHLGAAYLRYSFTKGTEQEVDVPGRRARADARRRGCSTSAAGPGRHAHALARRGIEVARRRHQPALRRPGHARRRRPGATFERVDARHARRSTPSSTRSSRCARGRSGWPAGRTAPSRRRRRVLAGMARALRPGGRLALSARSPPTSGAVPRGRRHLRRRHRRQPRAHRGARRGRARRATVDLWTSCYTPRELRLLLGAAGLRGRRDLVSVEPGAYGADAARPSSRPSSSVARARPRPASGRRAGSPASLALRPVRWSWSPCAAPSEHLSASRTSDRPSYPRKPTVPCPTPRPSDPSARRAMGTFDDEGSYTPRQIIADDLGMSLRRRHRRHHGRRSRTASSSTAPSSRSTRTRSCSTSATSPRASSPPASCRSATTSTRTRSSRSASRSRPSSSPRRTRKAAWSCPRSGPSTSGPGARSRRSRKPTASSRARSSRSSRAASSSTSACAASCPPRSSSCAGSATCSPYVGKIARRPRSSSSTRTATTWCCPAGPGSRRPRRSSARSFLTNLKPGEVRKGVVSSVVNFGAFVDLGGMDGLIHVSASCRGSTSTTPARSSPSATRSRCRCSTSTSTASASACR